MTRNQVISRLCNLGGIVMRAVFGCKYAADCLCERNTGRFQLWDPERFQLWDPEILAFIETAVREKIERECGREVYAREYHD